MSEQRADKEENSTETTPPPGGTAAEEPPGGDREPGSEEEGEADSSATVKVVLVPEGHVMTVAFAIGLSIQELKGHLSSELKVPVEVLQISLDGRVVEEKQSLMELGVRPHGSTRLEMSSTDPTAHPLRPLRPPEHDSMPDVISVQVQKAVDGVFREVVVEIDRPRQQKVFMGGYRHRLTGEEYHHAAVQTLPWRRREKVVVFYTRDTQTAALKSEAQQLPVDVSTQMTGIGSYVSCINDRLVTPGNYIPAAEIYNKRLEAVLCLQSFVRRWLAWKAVEQLRRERERRLAWLELQERRAAEEKEAQLRDRHLRWMNPQRKEDLNLLYQALEKWRCEEEQQINSSMRGAERKAALCLLLDKETQLISAIGRHRIAFQENNLEKSVRDFLAKSAASHVWRTADGRRFEMDRQHTLRARELQELYNTLNLPPVCQPQRLQVLMTLKHTVKEHTCQLARDIVDLIDREVDLMTRGVKRANLEGLRKRINTLFLQYIKTPAFNPEVARHLRVLEDHSQLKEEVFFCRSCRCYRGAAKFLPAARSPVSAQCRDCARLNNISGARDDLSCYKDLLRRLRHDEQKVNADAQIPFLLQVEDLQYLTEMIWACRSALQTSSDVYNLVFARWDRDSDWSPWNCILLSKEETTAHLGIPDIYKTYEAEFIRGIEHKHLLAQRHFSSCPVMAAYLLSAPHGNQPVSEPIATTDEHVTGPTPASAP